MRYARCPHLGGSAQGSTRATTHPELDKAVALARELRAAGVAVTLAVHEHKRLGRGLDFDALAEHLRAAGIGLEFPTGERQGTHDPPGAVFTVLAALNVFQPPESAGVRGFLSVKQRKTAMGGRRACDRCRLRCLSRRGSEGC
nr:recombinase family protein [Nonomuraea polychroma]